MPYRSPSMDSFSVPELRASDADRERVVAALRDHAAAGRLEPSELEERVEAALAARTVGDLEPLLADLPRRPPAPAPSQPRRGAWRLPGAWAGFLRIGVVLVVIWALTGAGYFWPVWPLIGLAFFALKGGCRRSRRSRRAWRESQRADAVWL
jgi:Domain of unknown function (DUF1707)